MGRIFKVSFGRSTGDAMQRGNWLSTRQFIINMRKTT